MKKFIIALLFSLPLFAEIPISNLPLYTGSQVGSTDTVPFVHVSDNTTGQLRLSQFFLIPSLQNPIFTGTLTVPTIVFATLTGTQSLTVPSGTFTTGMVVNGPATLGTSPQYHNLNTVSAAFASCGSLSGATGCVKLFINGSIHYIPYY